MRTLDKTRKIGTTCVADYEKQKNENLHITGNLKAIQMRRLYLYATSIFFPLNNS